MNHLTDLIRFYETLTPETLATLDRHYDPQARFVDPFNDVIGLAAIHRIFADMFEKLEAPRFEVLQSYTGSNPNDAMLLWKLHFRSRVMGGATVIEGTTRLRFAPDGRVILHRDYWDAAHELYARIPLLGWPLRAMRRALAAKSPKHTTGTLSAMAIPVLAAVGLSLAPATEATTLDVDVLSVRQLRNDVQIPNTATGTRFSLVDVLAPEEHRAVRLTLVTAGFDTGHQWRFMAAPLTIDGDGTLAGPAKFNGADVTAGSVFATYRFDSYRASYRWPLSQSPFWEWHGGITGKIRDAEITLRQGNVTSSKKNTGFVPLLHLAGEGRHGPWRLSLDTDALASPQGRAIDAGARVGYALSDSIEGFVGGRIIDGGADNDTVYNFARLRQWSMGIRGHF